jgi:hypothetical protein
MLFPNFDVPSVGEKMRIFLTFPNESIVFERLKIDFQKISSPIHAHWRSGGLEWNVQRPKKFSLSARK